MTLLETTAVVHGASTQHCSDAVLEEYCLHMLSEEQTAEVEEHLLVCEECAQRLDQQDEFVHVLKSVLGAYSDSQMASFQKSA